jgi:two-component system, LytTR family, sensor histidine kinase AlgZ
MHPILAKPRWLALYLLAWLPFAGMMMMSLRGPGFLAEHQGLLGRVSWEASAALSLPAAWLLAFMCLTPWYTCRSLPLAASSAFRLTIGHGSVALISIAVWLGLVETLAGQLAQLRFGTGLDVRQAQVRGFLFGLAVLPYLLSVSAHYLALAYQASQENERRTLQLRMLAREAELKTLRAQIDPHFLFNSLHSISALIGVDPAAARRMTVLLGEFLRTSVAVGQRDLITLGEELQLVDRYLTIEQVRFGRRLDVSTEVDPPLQDCLVPPLLLHPLVENAITHGIAHLVEGGRIRVRAARAGAIVHVTVTNTCDPARPKQRGTGVGLANVKRRLASQFPDESAVEIRELPDEHLVELRFPMRRADVQRADTGT